MQFALATTREIQVELVQRLKVARIARGLTQPALAARAGVSLGTIRNLEKTGDCSFSTVISVAQALRLESGLDELFKISVHSIADLIKADKATQKVRQRASRASAGKNNEAT